ncbi:MAG TPA: glycoside hydrolase family 97 protein [Candidatus Binatia bacterium]|jgi:alpha-glucosidase|nr:glycoside hydrolase family 97 protein [Candidatus Binatia bacterium]
MPSRTILAGSLLLALVFHTRASEVRRLASPDQRIRVSIQLPAPGSTERPGWSAVFQGKTLLANCSLGLMTADAGELMSGVRVVRERSRSLDQRIPVLFGKADNANDRFNDLRFTFETPQRRRLDVVFRCYDDAIAFRYELPKHAKGKAVTVTDETTSFRVEGEPTAYAQYLESYTTSHEHNVTAVRCHELRPGALLDMPLTFLWEDGTYAAITEGALRHYAGMSLMRPASETEDLVCKLTPRPDGTKVVRPLPMETPWRVVLIGDRPGALLESSTLYCLNEPSVIKDTSWIKPGKITFSWWNGDVYDGKRSLPILSLEMAKKYIDFCVRNGIPTHSLTSDEKTVSPWYYQSKLGVAPGPDTDVTRPRADFDLPAIRQYADSKRVRLWTWVHQGALRGRVEEAFKAFEKMGWKGMMVDFFDHDDQETIEFAESILQSAARHHIMIHFHGVWKPTGWQRTYPNLMNHEGALNLEYLKWSDRCTPEHNLNLAFTRLIAGPMDYHLGGFRAVTRPEFKPQNIAPNVLGSRCHQLAMYVCFDNPNPMVADYPTAYEGQPGFDFLKLVPTWWDETRVLEGRPGEVLVTARRKGKEWYLGGMSAKEARDLALPLSFLGAGRYQAEVWRDAPDAESDPNHLTTETLNLSSSDTLKIHVALDGGFVARIAPQPNR